MFTFSCYEPQANGHVQFYLMDRSLSHPNYIWLDKYTCTDEFMMSYHNRFNVSNQEERGIFCIKNNNNDIYLAYNKR